MSLSSLSPANASASCNLVYLRTRLGRQGWGDRRTCTLVRALIAERAFPAPLPAFTGKGSTRHLCDDPLPHSTWQRAAVDAWFDDQLPESTAPALDSARAREAAQAMDQAAQRLQLVGGSRA